jgi:hypothetical protein|tara:strand:- start:4124 stop:4396 length:273 start_codon:yes stop_codon:yes gene_type:complete
MRMNIISKYEETKAILRNRIIEGTISILEREKGDYQCYLCKNPIKGKIKILIDEELENKCKSYSKYPIDEVCYNQARLCMYSFGIPFSLS